MAKNPKRNLTKTLQLPYRIVRFRPEAQPETASNPFIYRHLAGSVPVGFCGRSIRDELIDTRLSLVKDRLRSTRIPIDRIGDFCGFRDVKNLKALFKRRFGLTMSDYRQTARS